MKPYRVYVDKFYNVLNVNNDALIVMCVVPDGLLTDYMARYKRLSLETRLTRKLYESITYYKRQ